MTDHGDKTAAFTEKLANLDIEVSVGTEGVYTACSSNEPRFCFDGYSQAEVAERVIEALNSYARLYFGLEDLDLRPNRQDIPEPAVRFEAPRPVSKLAVAFG
jgi:hypothetical protein